MYQGRKLSGTGDRRTFWEWECSGAERDTQTYICKHLCLDCIYQGSALSGLGDRIAVWEVNGRFDPWVLLALCCSVLEQATEPPTTPWSLYKTCPMLLWVECRRRIAECLLYVQINLWAQLSYFFILFTVYAADTLDNTITQMP